MFGCGYAALWDAASATGRAREEYVLFDLGRASLFEPVTSHAPQFRVTMYPPEALELAHGRGTHRYLIAREVLDADVVINLPKLKTHKKACITGALKNMVGMNGHKSYLPHHRKGAASAGGDCYGRGGRWKALAEDLLDRVNRAEGGRSRWWAHLAAAAAHFDRLLGGDGDVEGSWFGNDTVWRTVLDLQAILHFGRADSTLARQPQRKVLTITDAIVAGEGEGPLAPTPLPLGVLTMSVSTAAADWVHAYLMGLDPRKIPLTREAFRMSAHPIAAFPPESIEVDWEGERMAPAEVARRIARPCRPPRGWAGHCELEETDAE